MGKEFDFEKLKGSENYSTWKFAMTNFLMLKGLSGCIQQKPPTAATTASGSATVHPPGTPNETDLSKLNNCRAYLSLAVETCIYVHIESCTTGFEIWIALQRLYEDKGLSRKIGLLRLLISTRLEDCQDMQEYVDNIVSTSNKLTGVGFGISDEWLGAILLAGLTDEYKPFIMGIEANDKAFSGDFLISKLLDSQQASSSRNTAFAAKGKKFFKKKRKCFNCGSESHLADKCDKPKKPKKGNDRKKNEKETAFMMFSLFTNNRTDDDWYLDSGASSHMTPRADILKDKKQLQCNEITAATGAKATVKCSGDGNLIFNDRKVRIKNILHVPELKANLLSVFKIVSQGNTVVFNADGCTIYDNDNEIVAFCKPENGVYVLRANEQMCMMSKNTESALTWHKRLGHLNYPYMKLLRDSKSVGVDFKDDDSEIRACETCARGKQHKGTYKRSETRSNEILELVHTDVMGKVKPKSAGQATYLLTFVDDHSRKVFVYFIKTKDEVYNKFMEFKTFIENQTGKRIKKVRSDNGGEYISGIFEKACRDSGIHHQKTVPDTPQQNGVAERMNRTLTERAKCMLIEASLPKKYWAEAFHMAAYLTNRTPCGSLRGTGKLTPEECFSGKKCNLSNLKIFGSTAMVFIPKNKRSKLDDNSKKLIFVGYDDDVKGFRCVDKETGKLKISKDVIFHELKPKSVIQTSTSDDEGELTIEGLHETELPEAELSEIESPNESFESPNESFDDDLTIINGNNTPDGAVASTGNIVDTRNIADETISGDESPMENDRNDPNFKTRAKIDDQTTTRKGDRDRQQFKPFQITHLAFLSVEPSTVTEALNGDDKNEWQAAMNEEMQSHKKNETWSLVDLPTGKRAITMKWVFKQKVDSLGNVIRYKARVVARGCSQKYGQDYEETFAPVVRVESVRYLFALAAKKNLRIFQMDAITAFLQGELLEEVYTQQPEGYNDGSGRVCKLRKAVYGLKQAGRVWNLKLDCELKKGGWIRSKCDPCIYYRNNTIIAIYVDDFLIFFSDDNELENIIQSLNSKFHMKSIGMATRCIGIDIKQEENCVELNQSAYIRQILERFHMKNCKAVTTPMDINQKLTAAMVNDENSITGKVPYQEAVGSLLYLAGRTRPDISFALSEVSRFNSNHSEPHWKAVKRIFRYLTGTIDLVLRYDSREDLEAYSDSDWGSNIDDRKSCSGFVLKMSGGAISWCSKKQPIVALSTTEAEYIALSQALREVMWFDQFQREVEKNSATITIWCDNQSAMQLANLEAYRQRSKHIDIRFHHIREKINDGTVIVKFLETEKMTADSLTKAVPAEKTKFCRIGMGIVQPH